MEMLKYKIKEVKGVVEYRKDGEEIRFLKEEFEMNNERRKKSI